MGRKLKKDDRPEKTTTQEGRSPKQDDNTKRTRDTRIASLMSRYIDDQTTMIPSASIHVAIVPNHPVCQSSLVNCVSLFLLFPALTYLSDCSFSFCAYSGSPPWPSSASPLSLRPPSSSSSSSSPSSSSSTLLPCRLHRHLLLRFSTL